MKKKKLLVLISSITLSSAILVSVGPLGSFFASSSFESKSLVEGLHALEFSSSNQIISSQIKTNEGNTIWAKGDSSSGVTWNNGENKIAIAANGYIQTLSAINGIRKVKVEMTSGSISLYHGYEEPCDLETPMYESGKVFTSSGEYSFPSDVFPKRIRLHALEASTISKITLLYDCETSQDDVNKENIVDYGFENSYIDAGTIGKYASTSFVSGEGNTANRLSKRALKLTFKNTTNNYVSFNTQKDASKKLIDANPNFVAANVTLKAKFSSDIKTNELQICPIGSSWKDPGYQKMNVEPTNENGWYSYSYSFTNLPFNDNNSIIRFNLKPTGIDSTNKSTAYVLIDEVNYFLESKKSNIRHESVEDGLENLTLDSGWQNCNVIYDNETTFGMNSRNSICLIPGKSSFDNTKKWFVSLSPESDTHFATNFSSDYTTGRFEFNYKPCGMSNKNTVVLDFWSSWDEEKKATVTCEELRGGWYKCSYDLSQLGLTASTIIRINIGFGASSDTGKVYIDNITKKDETRESWVNGLENSFIDTGMSKYSTNTPEYCVLGSDTSYTSMKQAFLSTMPDKQGWQNQYAMMFQLDSTYKSGTLAGSGRFEAKLKFSSEFTTKLVRLNIFDTNWNAARFKNLPLTNLMNGWYQLDVDIEDLYLNWSDKSISTGFDPESPIERFGIGFEELTDKNASGRIVYIDDMFYTPDTYSKSLGSATIWQAYSTETILIDYEDYADRIITEENPLTFSHGRNGTDSSQVMIHAESNISSYRFKGGRLTNETGESLSPECFEVLVEKYTYVDGSKTCEKNNTKYGWVGGGYYPDATVPLENIIEAGENIVTSGNQQGLWINCSIPKEQSPGTYEGDCIITIDGLDYKVPTKVKVYNVTLDDECHNKTCFLSWDDVLNMYLNNNGLPNSSVGLRLAYYNFVAERHISPDHLIDYDRYSESGLDTYASFAEVFAKNIMPNDKIANYRLPLGNNEYDTFYNYLDALVTKNIEEWDNGNHVCFFDKAIVYVNDEPSQPVKKPASDAESEEAWANVKTSQTNFHQAINDIKSRLTDYPEIYESFVSMRNVLPYNCKYETINGSKYTYNYVKTAYYPNYFNDDYIDTPCPTFDNFNDSSVRKAYQDTFDQNWFYGCVVPTLPYPSYHLDVRLLNQRLIKWMQYDYNVEGEIYFATNIFGKWDESIKYWVNRDVWNDALVDGGAYGDGCLVYPGDRYNIYGPISTTRFENIRNASEDLELLYLFDNNVSKYNARTGMSYASARDFMSTYFTNLYTNMIPNKDTTSVYFNSARDVLLSQLEYCY